MKSNIIFTFSAIIIGLSIYVNYQTYNSLSFQTLLRADTGRVNLSYDIVNNSIPLIPNIGFQTLPMAAHKAFYAIDEGKLAIADSLITEADKINPYNYIGDGIKAFLFFKTGYLSEAYVHGNRSFYNWPKAILNYTVYNDILVALKDTTEIIQAFKFLPTYLKEDKEYSNYFRKSLSMARLTYLKIDYLDQMNVSKNILKGKWTRAYNFEGSKSVLDTTYQYKFTEKEMTNPSKDSYRYELSNDSIDIFFKTTLKKAATYGLQYSKQDSTLILSGVPLQDNKIQTQYFKKTQ